MKPVKDPTKRAHSKTMELPFSAAEILENNLLIFEGLKGLSEWNFIPFSYNFN